MCEGFRTFSALHWLKDDIEDAYHAVQILCPPFFEYGNCSYRTQWGRGVFGMQEGILLNVSK